MKSKIIIYLNIVFMLPLVYAIEDVTCNKVQNVFYICKRNGVLVYVNETMNEAGLQIIDSNLTKIASNAFQDLSIAELKLDLQGNPIEIQSTSFEGLQHVDTLVIYSATISLGSNLFRALPLLNSLSITSCKIVEFKKGVFAGLSKLERLYINYNNFSSITIDTFNEMYDSVMYLWLNNNEISNIDSRSFTVFSNLRRLQLSHNKLIAIKPETFHGFNKLSELFLNHNQLTIIQKNIFNHLTQLTRLDLSHNSLSSIEYGAFASLSMTFLNLKNNRLMIISTGAFRDISISELNLSYNEIRNVEAESFSGSKIELIYLKNNNVTIDKRNWGLSETSDIRTNDA